MIQISLSPETEAILRERARSIGMTPDDYTAQLVEHAIQDPSGPAALPSKNGTISREEGERRMNLFRNWASEFNPQRRIIDVGRDWIYEGRGE